MPIAKSKIKIIFPFKVGGVGIVMKNLYQYLSNQFEIELILTNQIDQVIKINDFYNNIPHKTLNYSKFENRYYIHKHLAKKINNCDLIIANDWLELETIANLKLKTKLIYVLHGDYEYYYNLAINNKGFIDKFVCVSQKISNHLNTLLPEREKDIVYLKNIIEKPNCKRKENINDNLRIIFTGRLSEEKGFYILPVIDEKLKEQNIIINWTIIGNSRIKENWLNSENVNWISSMNNKDVLIEYCKNDILILPSKAEGFPTVIVEAMFAGLIPLVSALPSGIPELVQEKSTGFLHKINDIDKYVMNIVKLDKNRDLLEKMSLQAFNKVNSLFNSKVAANKYHDFILNIIKGHIKKEKSYVKPQLSRLDTKFIPNFAVKNIRYINNYFVNKL